MKRHVIITLDHQSGGRQWRATYVWHIRADNESALYWHALGLSVDRLRADEPSLPIEARPVTLFYRAVKA